MNNMNTIPNSIFISRNNISLPQSLKNTTDKILLIQAATGQGKTTFVLSLDFLTMINDKRQEEGDDVIAPEEVLFVSPRTALIEKIKADGAPYAVQTTQSFKPESLAAGQYRMIILDEVHLLYSDMKFNKDFCPLEEWMCSSKGKEIIKVGITATPYNMPPDKFIMITRQLLPIKYRASEIYLSAAGGKATTALKFYLPQINSTCKAIVCMRSAMSCYKAAQEYGKRALALYSKTCREFIENEQTHEKIYLRDLMDYGRRKYVLENKRLPQDTDILFINAACEVGIDIVDENVQIMIVEEFLQHSIEQYIGRIRHDFKTLVLLVDKMNANRAYKDFMTINEHISLWEIYKREGKDAAMLQSQKDYYETQKAGPYIVNKISDDNYKIYPAQISQYRYEFDTARLALDDERTGFAPTGCETFYLNMLSKFCMPGTIPIIRTFKQAGLTSEIIAENNKNVADEFYEKGKKWDNVPIFKENQEEIINDFAMIGSQGRKTKFPSFCKALEESGKFNIQKVTRKNPITGKNSRCIVIKWVL